MVGHLFGIPSSADAEEEAPAAQVVDGGHVFCGVDRISLYHQGSADLDDEELRRDPVDVFLAGVAGREVTRATGSAYSRGWTRA